MNKQIISSRYSIPVIILLSLALIPTILHNYIGATVEDGKSVNTIPFMLPNFTSVSSKRNVHWGKEIFYSDDWFERNYQNKQYSKVRLFAARSFDHKRLYHHPELALSYGHYLTRKSIFILPGHPEIPVHILRTKDNSMLVAYTLLYDDEFIKNPIIHQLGESVRLLFNARQPMTLFYVSQSGLTHNPPFDESAAASLLLLAIQSFRSPPKTIELHP